MNGAKTLFQGLSAVLFPSACQCCGDVQIKHEHLLCTFCMVHLFEPANPKQLDSCTEVFLPEHIAFQEALWKYDKGGYLQELLIKLKYHGMTKLGLQLGNLLGSQLMNNPAFQPEKEYVLVPVPLHPARKRKRGYNQAGIIAAGISEFTGIPVIMEKTLVRIKNTRSQTGFDLNKRISNLKQAFRVIKPEELTDRTSIIVDDVFTTGTTAFELAATIKPYSESHMGIVTVALA